MHLTTELQIHEEKSNTSSSTASTIGQKISGYQQYTLQSRLRQMKLTVLQMYNITTLKGVGKEGSDLIILGKQ